MKFATALLACTLALGATFAQTDAAFARSKGCPPGLAKKNPPCVPPGQARKAAGGHDWQHHIGDVPDREDLEYLDDYWRYDLPALPRGQRYAIVDNRIVVIDRDTYAILQLIRAFAAIAN